MEQDIEDYLMDLTNMLNGQLRGAINLKAREENKELIMLTFRDVFDTGKELGEKLITEKYQLEQLKKELKDED